MTNVQQRSDKKCGYCGYILTQNLDLLQHSCFQPFDEDIHRLYVDKNLIITVVTVTEEVNKTDKVQTDYTLQDNIDELLIYHVSKKQALFDHRIPASDRSILKKNTLWQEVCNSMGGVLSVVEAKKRWRYLRDCFTKAKKKEHTYIPSGSATEMLTKKKNSFRFYEQMSFLDDILGKSVTCTNLSPNVQNNEESNIAADASESSTFVLRPACSNESLQSSSTENSDSFSRKRRKCDRPSKKNEFHDAIIMALRDVKQPDGVDGFLLLLGEGLRKLPYRQRVQLEMKYMAMLTEEQEKVNN